ncbi:GMC family oxidoreductase [Streptomyces sp. NBC_00726]|uniref:GMC oxidoreductase n=1 Tax=Streptomyces sp. NBC_00726 TaxID=2903674 RepID=UPI003862FB18
MSAHYDVIIIGTGAGGGTLARVLGDAGKHVLLLERGDFLPREQENWDLGEVRGKRRYVSQDTWYDDEGRPFQPNAYYYVGGATKMYGAALYRMRPGDFGEVRHIDGPSPAWPLGYDAFEPWYTAAEWLYQVHGTHGEDPTGGHWSKDYPWPAVSHEPGMRRLGDDLREAGYHPFPAPCGILLDEADRPRSACIRCPTCDGFPCLLHAKADAEVIGVRPVLDRDNVTLLVGTEVRRLTTDASGRTVTGVVASCDGESVTYTGDLVVLAAGAANTARILLRSASETHPAGLANGSDQVGRNYMAHISHPVLVIAKEPNDTAFQKTLGLNDFYFAGEGRPWPLGNIQLVGKSSMAARHTDPRLSALGLPLTPAEIADHAVDFWLTTEDLPKPGNRVTVDRDGNIHLAYRATNEAEADGLRRELVTALSRIGITADRVLGHDFFPRKGHPLAGVAHQAGTCRFGTDPATSVLDPNCKAHELDNLYVADAGFLPSMGAVNPALTIMANAIRVGEHLLERLN